MMRVIVLSNLKIWNLSKSHMQMGNSFYKNGVFQFYVVFDISKMEMECYCRFLNVSVYIQKI